MFACAGFGTFGRCNTVMKPSSCCHLPTTVAVSTAFAAFLCSVIASAVRHRNLPLPGKTLTQLVSFVTWLCLSLSGLFAFGGFSLQLHVAACAHCSW